MNSRLFFRFLCSLLCMVALFPTIVKGQTDEEKRFVYLYDSSLPDAQGLESDSLYSLLSRYVPDTLQIQALDMTLIDEIGISSLKDASVILVGETCEWDEESPLAMELSKVAESNRILCMNPLFGRTVKFEQFGEYYLSFETKEHIGRQVKTSYFDRQCMFFDDALGDKYGVVSIYDSSVEGKLYPVTIDPELYGYYFMVIGATNMDMTNHLGMDYEGLIFDNNHDFLYLGLANSMIPHLTPAGKNLVRNVINFVTSPVKSVQMQKPHLEGVMINTKPATADFMAELSTGTADYVLPEGKNIFSMYETNVIYGDKPCHYHHENHFNENYSEIFIEYEGKQDVYRINYLHEEDLAIESVMEDVKNSQSLLYDLQGRKLQVAKGLSIEGGRVVFRQ